jgi:PIN domain nuclease of toxin-antitoxin system
VKLLLDTHTLLWVLGEPERLRIETRQILSDHANTVFVSAVSLWEIVVKCRVGKLRANIGAILLRMAPAGPISVIGILPRHLMALSRLPFHPQHRDPFDHLIIAQAIVEGMMFITADQRAPLYPVKIMMP